MGSLVSKLNLDGSHLISYNRFVLRLTSESGYGLSHGRERFGGHEQNLFYHKQPS